MLTVTVPAESYDLVSLDDAKVALGLTDDSQDEKVAAAITKASSAISDFCARVFARETVVQTFRLSGPTGKLILDRYPLASITAVEENGQPVVEGEYECDMKSAIASRLAHDRPVYWSSGKVTITYIGGYDSVPASLQSATVMLVRAGWYLDARDPMIRREAVLSGLADSSYRDFDDALPPEVRTLLAPFRDLRAR